MGMMKIIIAGLAYTRKQKILTEFLYNLGDRYADGKVILKR